MEDLRRVALVAVACGWALSLLGPTPVSAQQARAGAAKPAPAKPSGTKPAGTNPAGNNPAGTPAGGEAKPGTPPAKAGSPAAGRPAGTKPAGATAGATPPAGKAPSGVRQVQGTEDDLNEGPADETGATVRPTTRRPARAVEADAEGDGPARLPRPSAEPLRIQKVSPELEKILKDWELKTSKIEKLQGDTRYREFDKTFAVEYRAEGKFAFEAPDRGNYELRPVKVNKGDASSLKDEQGEAYKLTPKAAERWVCTGAEILKIDEAQKTYEIVEIPEERRGDRIIEAPLPFLFGMKAEQAKQRYQIELGKETDQDIVLQLRPNWSGDAANWSKATVIISKTNYLPREVRLIAPGGTSMRIHTFENIKVNSDNIFRSLFGDDPFKPKLRNYKVVVNDGAPADAPAGVAERGAPAAGGAGAAGPGGQAPAAGGKARQVAGESAAPAPRAPATKTAGAGDKKPTAPVRK